MYSFLEADCLLDEPEKQQESKDNFLKSVLFTFNRILNMEKLHLIIGAQILIQQEKSHINVNHMGRIWNLIYTYLIIIEVTLEKTPVNAMNVGKPSKRSFISLDMKQVTQEKSP